MHNWQTRYLELEIRHDENLPCVYHLIRTRTIPTMPYCRSIFHQCNRLYYYDIFVQCLYYLFIACLSLFCIIRACLNPERWIYAINYIDFDVCRTCIQRPQHNIGVHRTTIEWDGHGRASKMFSLCEDSRRRRRHTLTCPLPVNGAPGHGDKSI